MDIQQPDRLVILKRIGDCFRGIVNSQPGKVSVGGWESVTKSAHMVAALIELLEVHDCGSIGGYDKGQQKHRYDSPDLFQRWDWLYRKYHNPDGHKFACNTISYEDIKAWHDGE